MTKKKARKAVSKSEERRLAVQSKPREAGTNAKLIIELTAKVEELERKQALIIKSFRFAADELRPLFGMGAFGVVFDAVYEKLSK